jgi:hypothetical protein
MKRLAIAIVFSAFILQGIPSSGAAAQKSTFDLINGKLDEGNLRSSLTMVIEKWTKNPRYFEAKCEPALDAANPLYPNIPTKECTYKEGALNGWVQLAVIPADMLSRWITSACETSVAARKCVARVTAYLWESNQFSFPVAGNIIEAGKSAGAADNADLNLVFLHGVTVPLPKGVPQRGNIPLSEQKRIFSALAKTKIVSEPAQVSRPAGVRREIYLQFAEPFKAEDGSIISVGKSCPQSSRQPGWLEVSRRSLVEAWNKPTHRLISAAAKALENGIFPGRINCSKS